MTEEEREVCSISGKICYSKREAGCIINDIKRFKNARTKNVPKRFYKCKFCGNWHLTHFKRFETCKRTLQKYGPRGLKEFF